MINSVILTGRLTADPESRDVGSGKRLCTFRLAVERFGPTPAAVDFIPVECWNSVARTVTDHLRKGRLVGVVGSLRQDRWTTPKGEARSRHVVHADAVQFLDPPPAVDAPPGDEETPVGTVAPTVSHDEDQVGAS